jgi:hypothetical protein
MFNDALPVRSNNACRLDRTRAYKYLTVPPTANFNVPQPALD